MGKEEKRWVQQRWVDDIVERSGQTWTQTAQNFNACIILWF
jgi:hypothetical protein